METATATTETPAATDGYQVGAVLYASWGYDQTNIDWYRVIARSPGGMLTLQELASVNQYDAQSMTGTTAPGAPDPQGRTIRRQLKCRDGKPAGCKFRPSYGWLSAWDGKPQRYSTYG